MRRWLNFHSENKIAPKLRGGVRRHIGNDCRGRIPLVLTSQLKAGGGLVVTVGEPGNRQDLGRVIKGFGGTLKKFCP